MPQTPPNPPVPESPPNPPDAAPADVHPGLAALAAGTHGAPHDVLGAHSSADGSTTWVRAWQPGAAAVDVLLPDGTTVAAPPVGPPGAFEVAVPAARLRPGDRHRFVVTTADGSVTEPIDDPYRSLPTLGDVDLHLIGEGLHRRLWDVLGARPLHHDGVDGTAFTVWAPSACAVRVIGDWNGWDGRAHPMRQVGASGSWELFLPHVGSGARYKFEVVGADGVTRQKADPVARWSEHPPATGSVVFASTHEWGDDAWVDARYDLDHDDARLSVYEVHLGSWRRSPDDPEQYLSYRDLAEPLADHVAALGFTHVELLPVAEHPFGGSWGYQVSGYYAPTARHGDPDGFRFLVDTLHQRGIGVIIDWVPAHFPRDEFALARFDGTALYEHADPRQGAHPDWGTLIFNYGRNEVRNFLVANALYWIEEFHIDGLRVDAVASMLYLDYSRAGDEWVPNRHGGRENLEAIDFLRELNRVVGEEHPGAMVIAEESTAFPGVSHPVSQGGLGFTHKWNMGWMHDTLAYAELEPVHRRWHHHQLTFGLIYAFTERFVLPLSHDEVVHLKGSMLDKLPGDDWQRFATLRALYAWMWSHPGGQLLFMGGEIAQRREWDHDRSIDWHLLDDPRHVGVRDLVARVNAAEAELPALWRRDHDAASFSWLDANDGEHSCYAFARWGGGEGDGADLPVVVAANFTPVPRHGYRLGVPWAGPWREAVNTDATDLGGSGVVNGTIEADDDVPWHGQPASLLCTLPPLGV
ncbi:MAG: 1,4-alpha-glucan branching protein GlgB, partial [Acidimicrobiales bacterium]